MKRKLKFYKHYFKEFYNSLSGKEQTKVDYVLKLISTIDKVPEKFLKHLTGTNGLYEIRVKYASNIYRIFCFFEKDNLVILLNGFQKKSQKTPSNEIEKADQLKEEYIKENKIDKQD